MSASPLSNIPVMMSGVSFGTHFFRRASLIMSDKYLTFYSWLLPSEFQLTLRSAPLQKVYLKPRVGMVSIDLHLKDGVSTAIAGAPKIPEFPSNEVTDEKTGQKVLKFVAGSTEPETFTMDSEHTYTFEVEGVSTTADIDGVAVNWTPADKESKDRLYPMGFMVKNLNVQNDRVRLCRRQASDGIVPSGKYIFRRKPACFHDKDQTPPKEQS